MATIKRVTAFIDWDAARRLAPPKYVRDDKRQIEGAVGILRREIAAYLSVQAPKSAFYVNWRVYHGWYIGKTKTSDRLVFEDYLGIASTYLIRNVSFSNQFNFSEYMLCATRRHPLYNTARVDGDGTLRQKMIDTALTCDLLHSVRFKEADVHIVVSEDDDFLPVLFSGEAWHGKVVMFCRPPIERRFQNTDGLMHGMKL